MLTLALKLAYRFYHSNRYGVLSKFMAMASTAGIGVGVGALIIGLSAMNGFEQELQNRVFNMLPNATIQSQLPSFKDENYAQKELLKSPQIIAVSKVVQGSGLLEQNLNFTPIAIFGINYNEQSQVIDLKTFFKGNSENFINNENSIIIGKSNLEKFNLKIGDEINLLITEYDASNQNYHSPKRYSFKIAGILDIGGSLDSSFAFINYTKAKEILNLPSANYLHIKTLNFKTAYHDVYNATSNFIEGGFLQTALQSQGKLYNDIQMIRQIMYIAMFLVMIVASFNIISKLIMSINEKQAEIAILKTMGSSNSLIMITFCCFGLLLALKGIIWGVIIGLLLALNLPYICHGIEYVFNITLLNKNIYFIDFIPSNVIVSDVVVVVFSALIISLIASIYPAIKATKNKIIYALN